MAYLDLLTLRVAAQLFECFVLLDAGPYRLKRRRGNEWVYIAAGVDGQKRDRLWSSGCPGDIKLVGARLKKD